MSARAVYLDLDGTLMGPGGCLFRGAHDGFDGSGAEALRLLEERSVPVVLVSGRTRAQLAETARLVGADGMIPELGALDADFPAAPGQCVADAIEATGVIDQLLAEQQGRMERYARPGVPREGTILLRGHPRGDPAAFVRERSGGTLRLADNGTIGNDGVRVWHVLPAAAGKGAAVARDVAHRGARPGNCLAVGNSREDLEMGRCGARVALVGNAAALDPALGRAAPWVTRGHYGAGVLEAVRVYLGPG